MVCSIQTVEAWWSGRPIADIRQLEQRQFRVERGENPAIEPRTVIDSRLTPLVERLSRSGVEQIAGSLDLSLVLRSPVRGAHIQ